MNSRTQPNHDLCGSTDKLSRRLIKIVGMPVTIRIPFKYACKSGDVSTLMSAHNALSREVVMKDLMNQPAWFTKTHPLSIQKITGLNSPRLVSVIGLLAEMPTDCIQCGHIASKEAVQCNF